MGTLPASSCRIALVGESRGEFLFLRHVADRMSERLGAGAVLEVELDSRDLTAEEGRICLVPSEEPEFKDAISIRDEDLVTQVRESESAFGVVNLRRLWRSDLLSWRDGASDDVLARQAIGYLRVFDRIFDENPGMVGGFAEEGGRLIKRAFRAVALRHAARMAVAFPMPLSNRLLFVDQMDPSGNLPPFDSFDPSEELKAEARLRVERLVNGTVAFARPRDLSLGRRRVANFIRLAYRQVAGTGPARQAHLGTFTRDYAYQRAQLALLDRFASREPPSERSVFYPIHVIHDAQMSIRGAPYLDQRWLIAYIAHNLPFGYHLLVKPHPVAPGQLSVTELLRIQRRLGNLRILHPSLSARDVLAHTSAMVTVNSTTGLEALMYGVPVVTLGASIYRNRGLTYDVRDPAELPDAVAAALAGPPPDREGVLRLVAYCLAYSHEVTPSNADPSRSNAFRFAEALLKEFGLATEQPLLTG